MEVIIFYFQWFSHILFSVGHLKGIGTSQTSKYVFGVFTYLSYRFHTHMNNRGAYYYRFDKILHLIQRAEASRGNVFYNELGDHVSRVEVYVLPAIGITC